MCLSFDFVAADAREERATRAAEAFAKAAHDGVTCGNIQTTTIKHHNNTFTVFCLVPIDDEKGNARMFMIPVKRQDAEMLTPCGALPCNAASLDALMQPGDHVPNDDAPVYRSLGDGAQGITIDCTRNIDGSCVFVLGIAHVEVWDERASLACFQLLTDGMEANGFPKSSFFEMQGEDVEAAAVCVFLDMLLPNVIKGHDMLVCLPGMVEGVPTMKTAFSLCFHYPSPPTHYPLTGLVHNDVAADKDEQVVEDNYYIVSNHPSSMYIKSEDATNALPSHVKLKPVSDFLPQPAQLQVEEGDVPCYRPIRIQPICIDPRNDPDWIGDCAMFQSMTQTAYWRSFEAVIETMGLPSFDKTSMYLTNLVGRSLPTTATTVARIKDSDENRATNVVHRMKKRARE